MTMVATVPSYDERAMRGFSAPQGLAGRRSAGRRRQTMAARAIHAYAGRQAGADRASVERLVERGRQVVSLRAVETAPCIRARRSSGYGRSPL